MPPLEISANDRVRLRHMIDAAKQAIDFSAGRSRQALDEDPMYRRAVVNCIQEIGEAAVRVSEETRSLLPELPWRQIIGMRNHLVHVYFNINSDFVWEVISKNIEPLIQLLQPLLEE